MSTQVIKTLDAAERAKLAQQAQQITRMPLPQVDLESGNEFVFVAHFDGTLNDKDNLALSGSPYPTNVARLHELMAPHAENNENYVSHYEAGVGTSSSWWLPRIYKAGVSPSGDMHAAAEKAYKELGYEASEWLKDHPDADPASSLKVIATGFSRGGGTAAIFSQMLDERGLKDPKNGDTLVPPGVLGLSGGIIFDPVTTGYKGNERFSPTSQNITVVRSQHEYRKAFRGVDYGDNPNINIVEVMGNHSDIGGSYDQGIAALVLENSRERMSGSGLGINPLSDEMRYRDDEPVQIHHENRLIFPVTHDPEHGVETGAARHLAPPSRWVQKSSFSEPAPPPNTKHRLIQAHTPLNDALWAVSITGREALSSLYHFTVRFKSDSPDLDCQAMIGQLCALELETDQNGKRWLSGQMVDFAATGQEGRHWVYEATVSPKLWHASHRADFRIWQDKTVPDILDQVLSENAVRFDKRLKLEYKTWTYLVQYRETDLNFILRQLEHEGIFFWFEHAEDGETLVLADHFTSHPDCPSYGTVPYYSGVQTRPDQDHFDGWRLTRRVETGRLIHSDYDFENPSSDLTTEYADPRGHAFDQYERFHYPGDYIDTKHGNQYAANTLDRLQGAQETVHLSGRVRGAAPGHCLTLSEHPRADQNRHLTLTAVSYDIADNDYEATESSNTTRFRVEVEAIPADRQFRPPLSTPKPRARGVETAVVVGPSGEEIHTDEYGRVKVHFHWDRYGQKDGKDTCWIRVASPWAGSNFGAIHIPRIGQEVIVDFEHGDPDRPTTVGAPSNDGSCRIRPTVTGSLYV